MSIDRFTLRVTLHCGRGYADTSAHEMRGSASCMMTSSLGNIFHVTGHLCGKFTDHQWIPRILMLSLICIWINGWEINGEAGDLRRHRPHYDVIVVCTQPQSSPWVPQISQRMVMSRLPLIMSWFNWFHIPCSWILLLNAQSGDFEPRVSEIFAWYCESRAFAVPLLYLNQRFMEVCS